MDHRKTLKDINITIDEFSNMMNVLVGDDININWTVDSIKNWSVEDVKSIPIKYQEQLELNDSYKITRFVTNEDDNSSPLEMIGSDFTDDIYSGSKYQLDNVEDTLNEKGIPVRIYSYKEQSKEEYYTIKAENGELFTNDEKIDLVENFNTKIVDIQYVSNLTSVVVGIVELGKGFYRFPFVNGVNNGLVNITNRIPLIPVIKKESDVRIEYFEDVNKPSDEEDDE